MNRYESSIWFKGNYSLNPNLEFSTKTLVKMYEELENLLDDTVESCLVRDKVNNSIIEIIKNGKAVTDRG